MKKVISFIILITFFLILGCNQKKIDLEIEKSKVKEVLATLITASEKADLDLLSTVYAHDPDMVCFGTSADERIVGWDNLFNIMKTQFDSSAASKYYVKDQVIKVNKSGEAAWFSEIIDWEMEYKGEQIKLSGLRSTGVLEKRNNNWLIVQLHYSIPASE